ncbi:MAG: hypothetical protein J7623_01600 [Chitinophaga sp.]|uniref:hypothetical protein n=1 Tax=Chitinophaga sp. TaxID=1869181 RepID=UPI001B132283|nr:hypothetical protein [Chitinophaga sp.]MBO9727310.1 hypothetical protein [Chitinophaga sp.]
MKKARIILVVIALLGIAGGAVAYFMPTVYYRPAYYGGECTVPTTIYYSVVMDTRMPGKEVKLARKPGRCETYIVIGQ